MSTSASVLRAKIERVVLPQRLGGAVEPQFTSLLPEGHFHEQFWIKEI
jgi:hypothetical protein